MRIAMICSLNNIFFFCSMMVLFCLENKGLNKKNKKIKLAVIRTFCVSIMNSIGLLKPFPGEWMNASICVLFFCFLF